MISHGPRKVGMCAMMLNMQKTDASGALLEYSSSSSGTFHSSNNAELQSDVVN